MQDGGGEIGDFKTEQSVSFWKARNMLCNSCEEGGREGESEQRGEGVCFQMGHKAQE